MRLQLFLLPACVLSLPAQDAWEALVQSRPDRSIQASTPWVLVRKARVGRGIQYTEELLSARAAGDFWWWVGSDEAMLALGRRLGVAPPAWALVDPTGQVRLHGTAEPTGKALREAMEEGSWIPRWDRRRAFLREHPGHGDATQDALREVGQRTLHQQVALIVSQGASTPGKAPFPGTAPESPMGKYLATPAGQASLLRPWAESLAAALQLPQEEPEGRDLWANLPAWELRDLAHQGPLQELLQAVLGNLESQIRRNPGEEPLWQAWFPLALGVDRADGKALIASVEAAPGTPWPTRSSAQAECLKLNAAQRLDHAEAALGLPGSAQARLQAWAPIRLAALLDLERFEEARGWILEARRRHRAPFESISIDQILEKDHPSLPTLREALAQAQPEPRSEAAEGLALVLLGKPAWAPAFESLGRNPLLDAWGRGWLMAPGELNVMHLEGKEELPLRTLLALPPGPRWVLAREPDICLAQGTEAPDPQMLAQLLRNEGVPLLERLESFLRLHPDHRQAREKLVEVLTERMPHPRLELKLAQACSHLGEAPILRKEDFKPQLPLWEPVARKGLAAAEARLQRWPESLAAWMAWMDWQSLLPSPASPAEHSQGLAIWKSTKRGGPGPLPLDVATGVARRLEQAGRWKALAEWGLYQWDGGWRKAMGWGAAGPAEEGEAAKEARIQVRKDLLTLAQLTSRALFTLGRKAELVRFQEEWRAADPSHGKGQGRVKP